jgi:hypothetical protein
LVGLSVGKQVQACAAQHAKKKKKANHPHPPPKAGTDGQEDRHDDGRVAFWNFANASKKRSK